jgi:DNA invertase Pin-like site-specific DNA recombinase
MSPRNQRKYVAYYRTSTAKSSGKAKGKDKLTFKSQKAIVNHYCPDTIDKEFTEIKSAKNLIDRPVLQQAIDYCVANGCYLIVAKVDRLSRTTEDALSIFSQLKGRLTCCDIPVEHLDKFTLTIFMAIADREKELIGIRTSQSLQELKKQGVKLGTPGNLTQEHRVKSAQQSKLNSLNHPEHQKALGYINFSKKSGNSFAAIANGLNLNKYKTSTGGMWSASSVHALYKRSLPVSA